MPPTAAPSEERKWGLSN